MEIVLPGVPRECLRRLDEALHRRDRRVGVISGGRGPGRLVILTSAASGDDARLHATTLVRATLDELGLASSVEVGAITGRPPLPGGPHRAGAAPPLDYRTTTLPDGSALKAACSGPMGEWFAFIDTESESDVVMAGRSLQDVLRALLVLPWGKKEPWFYAALEELAGHVTADGIRYPCPSCDRLTLEEPPPGTFAICSVCRWEDDNIQFRDPDYEGGANRMSLRTAREDYVPRP